MAEDNHLYKSQLSEDEIIHLVAMVIIGEDIKNARDALAVDLGAVLGDDYERIEQKLTKEVRRLRLHFISLLDEEDTP